MKMSLHRPGADHAAGVGHHALDLQAGRGVDQEVVAVEAEDAGPGVGAADVRR